MKVLIFAYYVTGDSIQGGSGRFMKCLGEPLSEMGHEVFYASDPKEVKNFDFDMIIYSHVISDMSLFKEKKICISHGIINNEEFSLGADVYISISEEVKEYNLAKTGINSHIIGQPIKIRERKLPNDRLKNILIIRNKMVHYDPFAFLTDNYNVRISDLNTPIEEQIDWADLCITLGRGALESMAQGKPVLVADNRDYNGAIGDGYVTKDNIYEIAKHNFSGRRFKHKITNEWIENELTKYKQMDGGFLYEYVKENHAVEKVIKKYLSLIKEIPTTKKKTRTISNQLLGIGIPCTFPFIPSSFFYSYALMEKPDHIFIHADNGPIDTLRNDIVEKAQAERCTHLIIMDVDQIYPANTITKLLSHKLPIVGCRVHRRYPPFDSLMLKIEKITENINSYVSIDEWEEGSLVEVDATGGGCIMYDMNIFKKMPFPWFRFRKQGNNQNVGEDIGFCQDLKAAGYKIYVDSSLECGHLTTMVVNRKTNLLYRSMKDKQKRNNLEKALKINA